jgi:hypothetical protein
VADAAFRARVIEEGRPFVIARSKATKQSTLTCFVAAWIASLRSQ